MHNGPEKRKRGGRCERTTVALGHAPGRTNVCSEGDKRVGHCSIERGGVGISTDCGIVLPCPAATAAQPYCKILPVGARAACIEAFHTHLQKTPKHDKPSRQSACRDQFRWKRPSPRRRLVLLRHFMLLYHVALPFRSCRPIRKQGAVLDRQTCTAIYPLYRSSLHIFFKSNIKRKVEKRRFLLRNKTKSDAATQQLMKICFCSNKKVVDIIGAYSPLGRAPGLRLRGRWGVRWSRA